MTSSLPGVPIRHPAFRPEFSPFNTASAFLTNPSIALPIAGVLVIIDISIPVWVTFIISGALLLIYIILNFNGFYIF